MFDDYINNYFDNKGQDVLQKINSKIRAITSSRAITNNDDDDDDEDFNNKGDSRNSQSRQRDALGGNHEPSASGFATDGSKYVDSQFVYSMII